MLFNTFNIYHVLCFICCGELGWANEIMKHGVQVLLVWEEDRKRRNLRIQEGMNGALSSELGRNWGRKWGGHKNLQMKWLCSMRAPFPHGVIIWKVQTYTSSQWGFPRSEPKELEPIFSCSSTVLTALNKKQLSKCPGHAGLNLILAAHQGKNAGVGALCSQHSTKSSCYNEMFVRHRRLNGSQYH